MHRQSSGFAATALPIELAGAAVFSGLSVWGSRWRNLKPERPDLAEKRGLVYTKLLGRLSPVPVVPPKSVHKESGFHLFERAEGGLVRTIDTRRVTDTSRQMVTLDMA